jgi:predicted regulator of Ras-like GTPase activity (Roadblock/LC7/MglB family)
MPLTGTLRDLSLPTLVQVQCSEQAHAQVTLTHNGRKGTLVFADGELIAATVDNKTGEEAVYELLTWEEGAFRVDNENVNVTRNVNTPWSALLLEGLRLADEARAERDQVLEQKLRTLRGKPGLRGALVTNGSGLLRADAKDQNSTQDAALIAFVAEHAETIGATLGLGAFIQASALHPNEKIVIEKIESNYLGCWFEPRTSPEQIKTILAAIK